jgi:two-component system, sensor histidine kinase
VELVVMFQALTNSIRSKLLLLIVAVTFIALLLSGAALLLYEAQSQQDRWIADLEVQADILGRSSSAAVAFDDRRVAQDNLEPLRLRPAIVAAAIYDENGSLFASFARDEHERPPAALPLRSFAEVVGQRVSLLKPIIEADAVRGAVYLRTKYVIAERIGRYAVILAGVMVLSLMAAVAVGVWLQRRITRPILAVAETAHKVVDTRDFSLRVPKTTSDEIGNLVDAFNTMLGEIGTRSEALVAADRMKDQFLATLAHELRNPLAPISNALYILKNARERPDLTASALNMMERQLRQMVRLVDDLLDVSRITTGKLMLRTENVSLGDIIQNAIEIARPLIEQRRHELVVDLPPENIRVMGDSARLAQVFSNLLNNAAKYTNEGGRIVLSARVIEGTVRIDVVDNGIGIAAELLPQLFTMFTQGDSAIERRVQSGLGVGLALAKRITEMHGGTIEAESPGVGYGSRFSVRLPVLKATPLPTRTAPHARSDVAGHRIVVVDDNVDFANSFAAILRDERNEVRVAYDGHDGIQETDEFKPDVAFVDIGMPTMNGYEVARELRSRYSSETLVLVAVTGWGQEADKAQAYAAGFDLHVVKPLDTGQLSALFESIEDSRAATVGGAKQ